MSTPDKNASAQFYPLAGRAGEADGKGDLDVLRSGVSFAAALCDGFIDTDGPEELDASAVAVTVAVDVAFAIDVAIAVEVSVACEEAVAVAVAVDVAVDVAVVVAVAVAVVFAAKVAVVVGSGKGDGVTPVLTAARHEADVESTYAVISSIES